jgi:hypothetical protein
MVGIGPVCAQIHLDDVPRINWIRVLYLVFNVPKYGAFWYDNTINWNALWIQSKDLDRLSVNKRMNVVIRNIVIRLRSALVSRVGSIALHL